MQSDAPAAATEPGRIHGTPYLERRTLLAITAAVAIGALLMQVARGYLEARRPEGAPHTSWSYRSGGFRALHDVLLRLGYRVERFALSYATLPAAPDCVLIVLDPDESARAGEENAALESGYEERLRRWVASGGVVVMTLPGRTLRRVRGFEVMVEDGEETAAGLGAALRERSSGRWSSFGEVFAGLPAAAAGARAGVLRGHGALGAAADRPGEWTVAELEPRLARSLRPYLTPGEEARWPVFEAAGAYEPLLTLDDRPLALERRVGDGVAIAVATPLVFANAGLRIESAAEAAVALLDHASEGGRRRLLFDEYAHGVIRRGGFLRWTHETALFYPLATALLAAALLAWHGAVRFGPPRPRREAPRRVKEEFVLSLGDLYRRGGHGRFALRAAARGYEARLAVLHGGGVIEAELGAGGEPAGEKGVLAEGIRLHEAYERAAARVRGTARPGRGGGGR